MDFEKKSIEFLKKYENSYANYLVQKIIKKLSKTKIDSFGEYINIHVAKSMYFVFGYFANIEIKDKKSKVLDLEKAIEEIMLFSSKNHYLKSGITYEWYSDAINYGNKVKEYLDFYLESNDETYYFEAIKEMLEFCRLYNGNYKEWQSEYKKYDKGIKRLMLIYLISIILAFSAIKTLSDDDFSGKKETITEETPNSFEEEKEEIDTDAILKRINN